MKQRIEGILWALSIGTLFVAGLGRSRPLLLILAIAWIVSTAAVIPLHFYRAWRRWAHVSNSSSTRHGSVSRRQQLLF